jgi:hypothetical protein
VNDRILNLEAAIAKSDDYFMLKTKSWESELRSFMLIPGAIEKWELSFNVQKP